MKIIYAINSDGFGHVTRSIPIIDHLLKKKHNISIITDKKVADFLKKNILKYQLQLFHKFILNIPMIALRHLRASLKVLTNTILEILKKQYLL